MEVSAGEIVRTDMVTQWFRMLRRSRKGGTLDVYIYMYILGIHIYICIYY